MPAERMGLGTSRTFKHFMGSEVSGGSVWGLMLSKGKQKLCLGCFMPCISLFS